MKYEIDLKLINNLKASLQMLIKSKQSIFSCEELIYLNNELNKCKPIQNNNKDVIPLPIKPKENDKK